MASIEELSDDLAVKVTALTDAQAEFEGLRAEGSAADVVKAAQAVTTAQRNHDTAAELVKNFALVGIYEGIKAQVLKTAASWDFKTLLDKDVSSVTISIPINADGIDAEHASVNTLGRKTVVKRAASANGGSRSRNVYVLDGASLNSREIVELHGDEVLGAEQSKKCLDEPGRYGLTHAADRVAKAKGATKQLA